MRDIGCLSTLFLVFWDIFWRMTLIIFSYIGSRAVKEQIRIRYESMTKLMDNLNPNATYNLFYCSSAGEYEQALPLMEALESQTSIPSVICFFSPSGISFAKIKGENRPYFLAPFDLSAQWIYLFRNIRLESAFIIRHELWPGFIFTAYKFSKLYLINAGYSHDRIPKRFSKWWKKWLFNYFDNIFCTRDDQMQFFGGDRSIGVGDTKYDRCSMRLGYKNSGLYNEWMLKKNDIWVVAGSVWPKDIDILIRGFVELKQKKRYKLIIAPHKPEKFYLEQIHHQANAYGLEIALMSEPARINFDILVVDCLGILAELYRLADLAYVGGGQHYQVHNVLEPAIFGIPVSFGPLYQNSAEAVDLVEHNLAMIIKCPEDFLLFCVEQDGAKNEKWAGRMRTHMAQRLGATNRIVRALTCVSDKNAKRYSL